MSFSPSAIVPLRLTQMTDDRAKQGGFADAVAAEETRDLSRFDA